jgi:hypothetical protein
VLPCAAKSIGRARWIEDLPEVGEGDASEERSDDYKVSNKPLGESWMDNFTHMLSEGMK